MNTAIQIKNLKKQYGNQLVLNGISFEVKQGEIFALLGVNGAGKTTTLECMEGLKKYESGTIQVNGTVGIQLQSASLPKHIKAKEAIQLFAKWNKAQIDDEILANFGINRFAEKQYHQLSTGQKRRLHLVLALLRNPDILFLDEPTAGLDLEGRASLHEQIRQLKAKGVTIILASHDMAEVECLCDRIAILNKGNLAFVGTLEQLHQTVSKQYCITITTNRKTEHYPSEHISETLLPLLAQYQAQGIEVLDIQVNRGSLEQHFIKFAKEA